MIEAHWRVFTNDDAADAVLETDRIWNGYSLCDLEPPLRAYSRVLLAQHGQTTPSAAVLILAHPEFTALVPHGDPAGIRAILAALQDRPAAPFILVQPGQIPAIEPFYSFSEPPTEMLRMFVTADTFQPAAPLPKLERLNIDDLPALRRLYSSYPASAFTADQLRYGIFFGVRDGDKVIAAGGTHALGPQHGIAAVGNIFVQPQLRGRSYGLAITSAIVRELLRGPYRDVILNVARANDHARRIYARLGFRDHCGYLEGSARIIQPGNFTAHD